MKRRFAIWLRKRLLRFLFAPLSMKNNPAGVYFVDENGRLLSPSNINGGNRIKIGKRTTIGAYSWVEAIEKYGENQFDSSISIGDYTYIGNNAVITAVKNVSIGDYVVISEQVYISDHTHGFDQGNGVPVRLQPLYSKGPVSIGDNCFIGLRVSILPGVSLGKGCVVAAHSVVNKSFPDYCMIAGVPAKLIKKYSNDKQDWESI